VAKILGASAGASSWAARAAATGKATFAASGAGLFGRPLVALATSVRSLATFASNAALLGGVHAGKATAAGAATITDARRRAGLG